MSNSLSDWPLDPAHSYLNHGGFGVTPRDVQAVQAQWRDRIEKNPTYFFGFEYPREVRNAAGALAAFVGASGDDVVFLGNATDGCNAVLRALSFAPGDEILIADLSYGAVIKAARYVAESTGAKLVVAEVPVPLADEAQIVDAFARRLSPRTRLVIMDHIVSATGFVMPIKRLADLAHEAGARVLIDGAHAPGQIPLAMPETGADWYVGNCHKWLFAPRACGFLWAAGEARDLIHPLAISHGYTGGMIAEFDWTGTRDPSALLSVPAAIAFHTQLGGKDLMTRNATLAAKAALLLASHWETGISAPANMFASMVTVRLPEGFAVSLESALRIRRELSERERIEAVVISHASALWLRVAAQTYNDINEYERLGNAIERMRGVLQ